MFGISNPNFRIVLLANSFLFYFDAKIHNLFNENIENKIYALKYLYLGKGT